MNYICTSGAASSQLKRKLLDMFLSVRPSENVNTNTITVLKQQNLISLNGLPKAEKSHMHFLNISPI